MLGAATAGCWMDTGEGGLSPYHLSGGCDVIMQIGTAKYGVRDAQGNLRSSIYSLLVESRGLRIVVDTCLGNDKQGRFVPWWNNLQGPFLRDLAEAPRLEPGNPLGQLLADLDYDLDPEAGLADNGDLEQDLTALLEAPTVEELAALVAPDEAAQVQAEQSAADLKRYRELHEQGFIGAAELERREGLSGLEEFALRKAREREGDAP